MSAAAETFAAAPGDLGAEAADPPDLGAPIARVRGEPLTEMPRDLYIPPDALAVILEAFEGPLDLLLYLIRRHNLDVLDIPMAEVTRQYMAYVEMMRESRLELAAEYLLMAALLIEIKSRMLLPRRVDAEAAEAPDPRAELVRRLLEYERMKKASQQLDALPQIDRDFGRARAWVEETARERLPQVEPADLVRAWMALANRASVTRHHRVTREELSVRAHMARILRRLKASAVVEFCELLDGLHDVRVLVVSFLAMLELARERLVEISQHAPFAPIYVGLATPGHADAA
ncbi:MAG: ScpA family protein [Betaproteobacteria bacterium]|nr:ScpA family protein [Betaproteobacteria bacterium]